MSGVPKACRLLVEPLPSTLEPARALLAFAGDHYPFALLGAWAGCTALLGSDPVAIHTGLDPFAVFRQRLCSPAPFPTSWQVGPFACHPPRARQLAQRRLDYLLVGLPILRPGVTARLPSILVSRCGPFGLEPVNGIQPSDHYSVEAGLRLS